MKQMTFADAEYAGKRKQTRKELFLIEMDRVVPWKGLIALIEPHYPKGEGGRPAYPLMAMLRLHLMQNWFGYSDPAMEEALYETTILRQFAGLSLERIPDETTILNFRRLLEKHELAAGILAVINGYLGDRGLSLRQGTIVDATLINAHDGLLRLRPPRGLVAQTEQGVLDLWKLARFLGEAPIPERAFLDGLTLEGPLRAVLLVENSGAWRDLPMLDGWLLAHVPGWDNELFYLGDDLCCGAAQGVS